MSSKDDDTRPAAPEAMAHAETLAETRDGGDAVHAGAAPGEGDFIGRYELLRVLGEGGMGIVYHAHDPDLERDVAIKLLRHRTSRDSQLQRRLVREAQAMARLSHTNLVTVHDVGVHQGKVFVAMEFVDGDTLDVWACERPWNERLDALLAAGRGLVEAHSAGIVHRDFKPTNVLVDGRDRILVADFGLARSASDSSLVAVAADSSPTSGFEADMTVTGAVLGTPAYMPPEQIEGESVDARADQFSFAVSVYELLYGRRPFEGNSLEAIAINVVEGRVVAPPSDSPVPAGVFDALQPAFSADPEMRYASLQDLLDRLERTVRPGRRAGLSAWITAAALVAFAALAAAWSLAGGEGTPAAELSPAPDWALAELARRRSALEDCMTALPTGADYGDLTFAIELDEGGLAMGNRLQSDGTAPQAHAMCLLRELGGVWWRGASPPEPRAFTVTVPVRSVPVALDGYRRLDQATVSFPRAELERVLDHPQTLFAGARISPATDGDTMIGFRLTAITDGSVYKLVGLGDGDIVQSVADVPLTSPDQVVEVGKHLRRGSGPASIAIGILRGGEPQTLTIRITP